MPEEKEKKSKKDNSKSSKKQPKKSSGCVSNKGPGPARYLLPPLTGYPHHDATRFRNPAFSFRSRQSSGMPCNSPGPKYYISSPPRPPAFSFGFRASSTAKSCTPGPYKLPDSPRSPIFTIRGRTNPRTAGVTPGPYQLPPVMGCRVPDKTASPCFTFGARPCGTKCDGSPGPKGLTNLDVIKPRAPRFSLAPRQTGSLKTCGPGPKYMYCYKCHKCAPNFSFGIRHSDCAPPMITECDEKC
ncbi:ciliary microtubule associated protein 1B [Neodiprion pinetum]|uniref:Outer dense fiber protein 3-B-like n=1 Tax=Neodiprion lecontei TaxID=441921 RepID=A0A6J0BC05_NEOLC|nr:outer dense fiber protein 3-B-like [Neodiprion lecontei]XP_046433216.1 outer dense fiber protein 3-B-like [Neodiprion fabricii]XP_046490066.1 outer dense fiber protein 3-B-like [Neodiprion pinetum]